uniref:Uncharacterized protein n=1 Tax=viral metagenome TaxID=1070528 RepID=A0A6M3Y2Q2_9ZZZZ
MTMPLFDAKEICDRFYLLNHKLRHYRVLKRAKMYDDLLPYWRSYYKDNKDRINARRREYERKIHKETGCPWKIRSFYPAARIIKALETAEIVEIKL